MKSGSANPARRTRLSWCCHRVHGWSLSSPVRNSYWTNPCHKSMPQINVTNLCHKSMPQINVTNPCHKSMSQIHENLYVINNLTIWNHLLLTYQLKPITLWVDRLLFKLWRYVNLIINNLIFKHGSHYLLCTMLPWTTGITSFPLSGTIVQACFIMCERI